MATNKVSLWTVVTFIVGALLGSGSIWQWSNLQLAKKDLEITEIRLDYEKKSFEIDKALKTAELRREIMKLQSQIIDLSDKYILATRLYASQPTSKNQNEANRIYSQIKVARDDLNIAEVKLAAIEEREPRQIQSDFIPPAAIGDFH